MERWETKQWQNGSHGRRCGAWKVSKVEVSVFSPRRPRAVWSFGIRQVYHHIWEQQPFGWELVSRRNLSIPIRYPCQYVVIFFEIRKTMENLFQRCCMSFVCQGPGNHGRHWRSLSSTSKSWDWSKSRESREPQPVTSNAAEAATSILCTVCTLTATICATACTAGTAAAARARTAANHSTISTTSSGATFCSTCSTTGTI